MSMINTVREYEQPHGPPMWRVIYEGYPQTVLMFSRRAALRRLQKLMKTGDGFGNPVTWVADGYLD